MSILKVLLCKGVDTIFKVEEGGELCENCVKRANPIVVKTLKMQLFPAITSQFCGMFLAIQLSLQ